MARVNVIIRVLGKNGESHEQLNNLGGNRTLEEFLKLGPAQFNRELCKLVDRTVHRKFGPNSAIVTSETTPNGFTVSGKVLKKLHGMDRFYPIEDAQTVNVSIVAEDGTKLYFREEKAAAVA